MYVLSLDLHSPLFEGSISEWNEDRKNLIYWLKFYNTYYYSLNEEERPPEYILQYNALMDHFVDGKIFAEKSDRMKNRTVRQGDNIRTTESFRVG